VGVGDRLLQDEGLGVFWRCEQEHLVAPAFGSASLIEHRFDEIRELIVRLGIGRLKAYSVRSGELNVVKAISNLWEVPLELASSIEAEPVDVPERAARLADIRAELVVLASGGATRGDHEHVSVSPLNLVTVSARRSKHLLLLLDDRVDTRNGYAGCLSDQRELKVSTPSCD
jgi:hypothetical protein